MTPCFQHDSYRRDCGDCRDMNDDNEAAMTAIAQAQDDDAVLVSRLRDPDYREEVAISAALGEQAADRIEALVRLSVTTPDTTVLVEALKDIRKLAMDDYWGTPKVCWGIITRIDTVLSSTANPTVE